MQHLIELERQGWQALSQEGDAGLRFYGNILHDEAVMMFPGGMVLRGKAQILEGLAAQPWQSFHLDDPRVISLSAEAGAVIYKVSARRAGHTPYVALVSSTYVLRDGEFRLVLHQQTPV
ncbi:nuclear transport factor 2 family protein [Nodosilinea sp. PGN35]|uniref:nuclear transport factor 2 family protein n=1 Tax=Nodosilinea sp. PGN35 TaxID=3020489 RepID=UPI0023B359A2|nr:nuclear transport factor 2 family protein [Nodosilinea sp. TSF1-S3]MDF0368945.1 nuclear transport factor 2 family protein [Nodosilinea sp. TSF1-S3]